MLVKQMPRARRDLGKFLVNIFFENAVTQADTVLLQPANQPGTITGLRWDIAVSAVGGSAGDLQDYVWCIYVLRQSITSPTLSLDTASALTGNLRDVIAFGSGLTVQGQHAIEEHGNTKSMRKLQRGDQLIFSVKPRNGAPALRVRGSAQFFYRT